MAVILGIDAGGTFTDGALIDAATGKVLHGTKTVTLHHALQSSIRACLAAFSEEGLRDLGAVCLSTTLATNALAEGHGGREGLILIGERPKGTLPSTQVVQVAGKEGAAVWLRTAVRRKLGGSILQAGLYFHSPDGLQETRSEAAELLLRGGTELLHLRPRLEAPLVAIGAPSAAWADGIRKIYEFGERTGMEIAGVQSIPAQIVGLPHEYWDGFPKQTSYEMRTPEDWLRHNQTAPVQVAWQDFHLASPAALETTENALRAGTDRLGCFSTLIWDYTGYHDEVKRFSDMVRSIGVVASKKELDIDVVTYPEDGLPGYFLDIVSWVGYTLVEYYITTTLCGANFAVSYGGLLTEVVPRMAFALAIHRLLSTEEHCALVYFNGGTIDQIETDVNANFGTGVQEMFIETLFNLKYQTPIIISPVAVTERLRTPSLEELLDITAAGIRCETKAQEWAGMMDWSPVEALAEVLEREGRKFFENVMTTFRDAGVDTEDPLQMIMMLKRFNPVRFEQAFHPSSFDGGAFQAFCPSQLGRQTLALRDEIVSELRARQTDLRGRRVVCASADGHSYGLMLIGGVYGALGAGREFPARRFCHRRHFRQRHVRLRQPFF